MTCFILEISLNPSNQETDRIKTREFIYISTTDFKDFPWQPTFFTSRSFVFVKSSISTNKTLDHWQWVQRIQSNSALNLKTLKAYTLRNIEKKRKQQNSQKKFFFTIFIKGQKRWMRFSIHLFCWWRLIAETRPSVLPFNKYRTIFFRECCCFHFFLSRNRQI